MRFEVDLFHLTTSPPTANNYQPKINDACIAAADLVRNCDPTYGNDQSRGNFDSWYFSCHRGSVKHPRMSQYFKKYPALFSELCHFLNLSGTLPVAIFKAEFPLVYDRYAQAMDMVQEKVKGVTAAFYPFASFCINISSKGVIAFEHIDAGNLAPGLCVVIPWGYFDPAFDCKLHVELGYMFQLAAGTPIYFPSALFTHYNSKLITMGMRGSLVAWTGASLFQYVDLGCRAVNDLTKVEKKKYLAGMKARVMARFDLFPRK
ncbi:hypothetical protein B0H11DRAFT_1759710 [Mycena galericulata]|nr:hypothetical protein B0H11DRAFT_1759710 [Mycena galericulata]